MSSRSPAPSTHPPIRGNNARFTDVWATWFRNQIDSITGLNHLTDISNVGTNTHAQIDTAITNTAIHIADSTIHFTEASIDHVNIQNIGTNTHAQIDTAITNAANHIASTSNPHSVTAAQVGNTTAQWNADQIQGVDVLSTAPTDLQVLQYIAANSRYEPTTFSAGIGGSGTLNTIPLWTPDGSTLGDSVLTQDSPVTTVSCAENFNVTNQTDAYQIASTDVVVYPAATNFFLGPGAGVGSSTTYLLACGEDAGRNCTGLFNTVVGYQALYSGTSGRDNTAVGWRSQYSSTSGNFNVSLGTNSLQALTSGSGNLALGVSAGQSLTTGSTNFALGRSTLALATTASNNVCIGSLNSQKITTGNGNVFIGTQVAQNGTGAASNNVAIGNQSGLVNSANENTYIGFRAGGSQQNGTRNTMIGASAGYGASIYSVDGCVLLGYNAGITNTRDDTLMIENSNDVSTPLIYGEFDNDYVKVNGSFGWSIQEVSATATDTRAFGTTLVDASGGAITRTLPAAASYAGEILAFKKIDSSLNVVTIDGNASETIDGATTATLKTQYESIIIQSDGTEWWIL